MVPPMLNVFYLQVLLFHKFKIKVKIAKESHKNDGLRDTPGKTLSQSRNFGTSKEHWCGWVGTNPSTPTVDSRKA